MAWLNLSAIEERMKPLGRREVYDQDFIFDLLAAYGRPKSTISRLKSGHLNVAQEHDREVALKNYVYFSETQPGQDTLELLEKLRLAAHVTRYSPRFIIVTDYQELLAADTKTGETLATPIAQIDQKFTFFLPWAGMEKAQYTSEAHADVKAAEKMGKLFDELLSANPHVTESESARHLLNVFFTRLLFCFFAEDTGIFDDNQFTNAVSSFTQADGSDTREFLTLLFDALDTSDPHEKTGVFADFPYVNGRLFSRGGENAGLVVPAFTQKARESLIELGTLKWQEINPDIFGSMFQAVVAPGKRSDLGQHYTSVPNILKTIEPLFLDELREEFDAAYNSVKKLQRLLDRIADIRIFDPACGSGNFLVIAYKELRRLEHAILERLQIIGGNKQGFLYHDSQISIEHFYGIEIDDFAVEVAVLSLWIAKHQMNREFKEKFSIEIPLIPLKETGQIKAGNATRLDWNQICPNKGTDEIYLIGNPPYVGSSMQTKEQKADFPYVFGERPYSKKLDYIALWFVKGADYIRGTQAQLAFVSTNSVAQGDHVALMFPTILSGGIEIGYAYTSFKWENNAKRNAGVTVVVISLRNESARLKRIFSDGIVQSTENISPYLTSGSNVIVNARKQPLSTLLPPMLFGSKPTDGGNLILEEDEKNRILEEEPKASQFLKKFIGADDFIKGKTRYCVWVDEFQIDKALSYSILKNRFDKVAEMRISSKKVATQKLADKSYAFAEPRFKPTDSIIVPSVSSERRSYIPIGFVGADTVISNLAYAIYDAEPWLFALLTSRLHMAWVAAVGGKLETRLRYTNTLVYNNFPVPPLSEKTKEKLTAAALRVLDVREYHCEKTLAELYGPEKMPDDLKNAHLAIDYLVDSLYSKKPFETDEERLAVLFDLYEKMIAEEAEREAAAKAAKKTSRSARGPKATASAPATTPTTHEN
ncbi:DNA methyltransferase [Rothia nasimurium]|uniref:DNA methyltransferase n=1 Tax=Rothia nasimurium TaxID=85336 RepID=UPI001F01BDAC|nr:DNA methyltransferase [Rothia nasimurium]